MATVTKGITYGATEQITNTKLHNLVDLATVTSIAFADLSTGLLSSLPSTSGLLNPWNLQDNILSSLPSMSGRLRTLNMVTSLASGAMIRHNGSGGWYASMT